MQGVPFFSEDMFPDVVGQLNRCQDDNKPKQTMTVTGLDGTNVHFLLDLREDHNRGFR